MILSNRNGLKNTRNTLRVFGGLNETYSCTEAEYSAGINFSARNFPALSTRLPRRKLREEADLNGMYRPERPVDRLRQRPRLHAGRRG